MKEIREADWKVFRKLHPILLDRYCQKVLREINRIGAEENKSDHERYLAVYQEVQKHDREIGLLFNNPRRSSALMQLMAINDRDLFTEDTGHLFQNRYKSIVCEEEPYLLELIRYIHLNPLRAGLVKELENLDL